MLKLRFIRKRLQTKYNEINSRPIQDIERIANEKEIDYLKDCSVFIYSREIIDKEK